MKKSERIDNPEELDFTSCHFNAFRALHEPRENVVIPRPEAPMYDNLSCFIETKDGIFPKERKLQATSKKKYQPSSSTSNVGENETETTEDNAIRKRKYRKNVLTRMDNIVSGPLSFLKKCMDEKLRIKIYTRGAVSIRGFCLGFLEAFDKHWNLVLKDVFEQWIRRRKLLLRADDDVCEKEATDLIEKDEIRRRSSYKIRKIDKIDDHDDEFSGKPKIVVKKRFKRKEICERHVDQLLIRGEQIVFVTLES